MSWIIKTCLLIFLSLTIFARPQPVPIGVQMDNYLTRLAAYGFAGTVLVAKGDEVLLHKGYGWADRQQRVPNTTSTLYDIASLAKQFTATAILKLESEKKLQVSDSIATYFPDVPADKRAITLHHLLTHTSGLPFECAGSAQMTREQFVQCMLSAKLHAAPGKQYEYSNAGFSLLAAIIELVTKQSYESYLQTNLFAPAGMKATCFQCDAAAPLAHAYDESLDRGTTQTAPATWQKRGAWGLSTTTADLWKWEQSLRQHKILSEAATKKLFTFHVPTNEQGAGYGYGWAVQKTRRGTTIVEHDGTTFEGFNALYQRYVEDGVTVIILSNRFYSRYLTIHTVAPGLAGILSGTSFAAPPAFVKLAPEQLQRHVGTYQLPSGAKLLVTLEHDALQIGAEGQEAINVLTGVDAAQSKWLAQHNERTARFLKAIQQHEAETVGKAFAGQMPPAQAQQEMDAWLARLEKQHGALKAIEVVGTVPEPGIVRSFVRLHFARSTEIRRLRWDGETLGNLIIGTLPLLKTTLQPQTATDFTGFHIGLAKPIALQFVTDPQGAGLKVQLEGKLVTARKIN